MNLQIADSCQEFRVELIWCNSGLGRDRITLLEECHNWFISDELLPSLNGGCLGSVENLYIVLGIHLNSGSSFVGLIKRLADSAPIVKQKPSVLHQLNVSAFKDRTTL